MTEKHPLVVTGILFPEEVLDKPLAYIIARIIE